MFPVIPFGFKVIRQSGKDHRGFCMLRRLHRFREQCFIRDICRVIITLRIDHIRKVFCLLQRGFHPEAVDVGAAAALVSGSRRIFTDKGGLCFRG